MSFISLVSGNGNIFFFFLPSSTNFDQVGFQVQSQKVLLSGLLVRSLLQFLSSQLLRAVGVLYRKLYKLILGRDIGWGV